MRIIILFEKPYERKNLLVCLILSVSLLMSGCMLSQSRLERGKNYLDKKNYVRAIQELEKAANEEGGIQYYIDVYSYLGDAYAQNGEPSKALSVYRNALQIIHLRIREIDAQRRQVRRSLNVQSDSRDQHVQEEDLGLADEEWQLKERGQDINNKIKKLEPAP